jgi:hypothetical protein
MPASARAVHAESAHERKELGMRSRLSIGLTVLLASGLVWGFLGKVPASGAVIHYINLAAPSFMGHDNSVHNGGSFNVCFGGSAVPLQIGDENRGDLQNGKGSFIQAVIFPNGVTVRSFRLYANDNDGDLDSYAYLIRKQITPNLSPAKSKYLVMASVKTSSAVLDTLRRFLTNTIHGATIDNTRFMYYVELVNCATTVEPFAVQILYS